MSYYTQFTTADGRTIWVEVEGSELEPQAGIVKAGLGDKVQEAATTIYNTFEDALDTVQYSASAIIDKIRGLGDRPDEIEVTFGLKAIGEAGGTFALAKAGVEANYTIKLVWKRQSESEK